MPIRKQDIRPWHAEGSDAALAALGTSPRGLTEQEVQRRRQEYGPNLLPEKGPASLWLIVLRQFVNPLIYILVAAAVVSAVIGEVKGAGFIAAVLAINAVIGSYQESQAEKSSHALRKLLRIHAQVERDGEVVDVMADEVVPSDVVWLESGNRVPADIRLISAQGLDVDESLLTGESLAVTKDAAWMGGEATTLADRQNMAFAGSMVARGRAKGVVVATGLIRYAAMVARLGTAREVRFVHVLPTAADPTKGLDHDHAVAQLKSEVATHFLNVPETAEVYYDVLKGPLLDRLLHFAAEQEDDVVFVHGGCGESSRRSLARRLAMNAPCSVWMVPDDSPPQIRRILVPIDFSEHAADALQVAMSLAKLLGHTECLALHVYFNEAAVTFEEYERVLRGQEEQASQRFIAPLDCHGVQLKPLFVEGAHVAGAILRVADEQAVDLIVLPCRGRSRSAAILLGSVAEETIIESRVPTLIVKHFGARLGLLQVLLDRRFQQRSSPRTG